MGRYIVGRVENSFQLMLNFTPYIVEYVVEQIESMEESEIKYFWHH